MDTELDNFLKRGKKGSNTSLRHSLMARRIGTGPKTERSVKMKAISVLSAISKKKRKRALSNLVEGQPGDVNIAVVRDPGSLVSSGQVDSGQISQEESVPQPRKRGRGCFWTPERLAMRKKRKRARFKLNHKKKRKFPVDRSRKYYSYDSYDDYTVTSMDLSQPEYVDLSPKDLTGSEKEPENKEIFISQIFGTQLQIRLEKLECNPDYAKYIKTTKPPSYRMKRTARKSMLDSPMGFPDYPSDYEPESFDDEETDTGSEGSDEDEIYSQDLVSDRIADIPSTNIGNVDKTEPEDESQPQQEDEPVGQREMEVISAVKPLQEPDTVTTEADSSTERTETTEYSLPLMHEPRHDFPCSIVPDFHAGADNETPPHLEPFPVRKDGGVSPASSDNQSIYSSCSSATKSRAEGIGTSPRRVITSEADSSTEINNFKWSENAVSDAHEEDNVADTCCDSEQLDNVPKDDSVKDNTYSHETYVMSRKSDEVNMDAGQKTVDKNEQKEALSLSEADNNASITKGHSKTSIKNIPVEGSIKKNLSPIPFDNSSQIKLSNPACTANAPNNSPVELCTEIKETDQNVVTGVSEVDINTSALQKNSELDSAGKKIPANLKDETMEEGVNEPVIMQQTTEPEVGDETKLKTEKSLKKGEEYNDKMDTIDEISDSIILQTEIPVKQTKTHDSVVNDQCVGEIVTDIVTELVNEITKEDKNVEEQHICGPSDGKVQTPVQSRLKNPDFTVDHSYMSGTDMETKSPTNIAALAEKETNMEEQHTVSEIQVSSKSQDSLQDTRPTAISPTASQTFNIETGLVIQQTEKTQDEADQRKTIDKMNNFSAEELDVIGENNDAVLQENTVATYIGQVTSDKNDTKWVVVPVEGVNNNDSDYQASPQISKDDEAVLSEIQTYTNISGGTKEIIPNDDDATETTKIGEDVMHETKETRLKSDELPVNEQSSAELTDETIKQTTKEELQKKDPTESVIKTDKTLAQTTKETHVKTAELLPEKQEGSMEKSQNIEDQSKWEVSEEEILTTVAESQEQVELTGLKDLDATESKLSNAETLSQYSATNEAVTPKRHQVDKLEQDILETPPESNNLSHLDDSSIAAIDDSFLAAIDDSSSAAIEDSSSAAIEDATESDTQSKLENLPILSSDESPKSTEEGSPEDERKTSKGHRASSPLKMRTRGRQNRFWYTFAKQKRGPRKSKSPVPAVMEQCKPLEVPIPDILKCLGIDKMVESTDDQEQETEKKITECKEIESDENVKETNVQQGQELIETPANVTASSVSESEHEIQAQTKSIKTGTDSSPAMKKTSRKSMYPHGISPRKLVPVCPDDENLNEKSKTAQETDEERALASKILTDIHKSKEMKYRKRRAYNTEYICDSWQGETSSGIVVKLKPDQEWYPKARKAHNKGKTKKRKMARARKSAKSASSTMIEPNNITADIPDEVSPDVTSQYNVKEKSKSPQLPVENSSKYKRQSSFNCVLCPYYTSVKATVIEHIYGHTPHIPFQCNICGERFGTKSGTMVHHRREHKGQEAQITKHTLIKEEDFFTEQSQGEKQEKTSPSFSQEDFPVMDSVSSGSDGSDVVVGNPQSHTFTQYSEVEMDGLRWNNGLKERKQKPRIPILHVADPTRSYYQCRHCTFSSNEKPEMLVHISSDHSGDQRFMCPLCEVSCLSSLLVEIRKYLLNLNQCFNDATICCASGCL